MKQSISQNLKTLLHWQLSKFIFLDSGSYIQGMVQKLATDNITYLISQIRYQLLQTSQTKKNDSKTWAKMFQKLLKWHWSSKMVYFQISKIR